MYIVLFDPEGYTCSLVGPFQNVDEAEHYAQAAGFDLDQCFFCEAGKPASEIVAKMQ